MVLFLAFFTFTTLSGHPYFTGVIILKTFFYITTIYFHPNTLLTIVYAWTYRRCGQVAKSLEGDSFYMVLYNLPCMWEQAEISPSFMTWNNDFRILIYIH